MTRLIRWVLAVAAGVAVALVAPGGAAAGLPVLDGVELYYLPAGLGTSTDFEYEYDDVAFAARIWESGSDTDGWRVDLAVRVLRGDRLADPAALHDWFIAYEERPPGEAQYRPVRVNGHRGWSARDEIFWLERPGLALAIRIDVSRWSTGELLRTAWGVRVP